MKVIQRFASSHGSRLVGRFVGAGRLRMLTATLLLPALLAGVARAQSRPLLELENQKTYSFVLFDLLEAAPTLEGRTFQWDMFGWIGKEYDRFFIKSDGNLLAAQRAGEMEFQALYSRLVAPYWEAQVGARFDVGYTGSETNTRARVVFGLQGLAPYWFELEPAVFISASGDVAAGLTGAYDLLLTQRLVLQPRLDVAAALQEVKRWGVGSGLNSVRLGARLRYEIRREFAPYVGLSWTHLTGGTAGLARRNSEDTSPVGIVLGVRLWW